MSDLKSAGDAMQASAGEIKTEIASKSFVKSLIAKVAAGGVGLVGAAARVGIVTAFPLQYQKWATDLEKMLEQKLDDLLEGHEITVTHEDVITMHVDVADAMDQAIGHFAPAGKIADVAKGLAHAAEDAAANAADPGPHI